MEDPPSPFTNWGDWLIWRATGSFGDFRMPVAISIMRTERSNRGWFDQFRSENNSIRRVLARYKEHVIYWNITIDVVQRELGEFAGELGIDSQAMYREYDWMPVRRFLPQDSVDISPIGSRWG